MLVLPPSPLDWLPENLLVFFLLDLAAERERGMFPTYYRQEDPRSGKA